MEDLKKKLRELVEVNEEITETNQIVNSLHARQRELQSQKNEIVDSPEIRSFFFESLRGTKWNYSTQSETIVDSGCVLSLSESTDQFDFVVKSITHALDSIDDNDCYSWHFNVIERQFYFNYSLLTTFQYAEQHGMILEFTDEQRSQIHREYGKYILDINSLLGKIG